MNTRPAGLVRRHGLAVLAVTIGLGTIGLGTIGLGTIGLGTIGLGTIGLGTIGLGTIGAAEAAMTGPADVVCTAGHGTIAVTPKVPRATPPARTRTSSRASPTRPTRRSSPRSATSDGTT